MLTSEKFLFIFLLVAATQATRLIPLIFENKLKFFFQNESVRYRLNDIMFFLLILYCFRDIKGTDENYLRVLSALIVFAIQFKTHKTLISIFVGTGIYIIGLLLI